MDACSVKRVAGTCIELFVYICQLILFPMQKQCYVVLRTIAKSVEIQGAVILI
jgi:hypothetical protein